MVLETVVRILDCAIRCEGEKKVWAISMAQRIVILAPLPVSAVGNFAWLLSTIFASVAVEVVSLLEGEMIVAAQTMGETSTDGSLVWILFLTIMLSSPTTDFTRLDGVEITVGDDDSAGEETDLENPQGSLGLLAIPDSSASPMVEGVSSVQIVVGVLIRLTSISTTIVQLCDGKEDRSGDGGGDHVTEE